MFRNSSQFSFLLRVYRICGLFIVMVTWLLIPSCVHDPILGDQVDNEMPGPKDTLGFTGCDTNIIYFNRDILPIFTKNCAISGCHDKRTAKEGYDFSDYNNITKRGLTPGRPENSKIYEVITTSKKKDVMPPSPYKQLSAKDIQLIFQWITSGLKNDTCLIKNSCDTSSITFSKTVLPIFDGYCVGCHGTITSYAGLRLNNYANVQDALNSARLLGAINWGPGFIRMPLDQAQLLGCDIKKIEIWVKNGAKND